MKPLRLTTLFIVFSAFATLSNQAQQAPTEAASPDVTASTVTTTGGTSDILPVFTGTSVIANSKIYYSNGSLGIGKSPACTLNALARLSSAVRQ